LNKLNANEKHAQREKDFSDAGLIHSGHSTHGKTVMFGATGIRNPPKRAKSEPLLPNAPEW
jgi:hypothetical protein